MFQRCFTLERRSTGKTMKKIERVFHWNTTARVHGRGKTLPKWVIEQKFARLTIKRELPSEEDLMFEDAEAREQDMKF